MTLTDSLRVELRPWGISVSLVEAGNVRTPIWEKHLQSVDGLLAGLSPEERALYQDALAADMEIQVLAGRATRPARRQVHGS